MPEEPIQTFKDLKKNRKKERNFEQKEKLNNIDHEVSK